jgi:glycosyltransferase involved in cell wall biosynthesis
VPAYGIGGVECAAETSPVGTDGLARVHFLSTAAGQPRAVPREWVSHGPQGSSLSPAALICAIRKIRQAKPDVLVFSLWRSVLVFIAAKLLFPRIKTVLFLHSETNVHWLDALATRFMARTADAIWADSEPALSRAKGREGTLISMVLHWPADLLSNRTVANPAAFISWCRLNPSKRVDRALALIAKIKERVPQVHYTLIGPDDGELRSLRSLALGLGLEENVEFAGPKSRSEIEKAASSANFYLQLSDYEGQAMAVIEAMQLRLVPVVTPVGGIPTYSTDGLNAVFVDDLDVAAGRLEDLIQNPALTLRMSDAAHERFAAARTYAQDFVQAARTLAQN